MAYVANATRSDGVDVLITDTPVVARNTGRFELTIVNDSANLVYLVLETVEGVAPVATANNGIRLNANGGSWTTGVFRGAINAIALTATSRLTVTEI